MIELLFSDTSFGTHEYGFIPRKPDTGNASEASEREDVQYARYLKTKGIEGARIVDGIITIPAI